MSTVIKLFEAENELKCKYRLHDFIETLCLFSNIWENSVRLFTISKYRYNYLKFLYFHGNRMTKSLRIFSSFMTVAPDSLRKSTCIVLHVGLEPTTTCIWNNIAAALISQHCHHNLACVIFLMDRIIARAVNPKRSWNLPPTRPSGG